MEPLAIIAIVAPVVAIGAYALGRWMQKRDDQTMIDLYKEEIARLQASEDDLRASLYHRIGFKREQPKAADSSEPQALPAPNNSVDDREHKSHGFPDLFHRRQEAFAEDHAKMKKLQQQAGS